MDYSALLQAQQQDFYNRLQMGNEYISQISTFYKENCVLEPEIIKQINLESDAEAQKIVDNKLIAKSPQEISSLLFYRYLAKESFLSQFENLTYLESSQEEYLPSNLTNCSFTTTNNPNIRILLKVYQGDLESIKLTVSLEELTKHKIFVFSLLPHNANQVQQTVNIIFLGFITFNSLQKRQNDIDLKIKDLLYIGGFNYYISNNFFINELLLISVKKYLKQGDYLKSIHTLNEIIEQNSQVEKYYFFRGICQYKLGNNQLALSDLEKVTNLNKLCISAYHWQGLIYQELCEYKKAFDAYTQEIKVDSLNFFAYFHRAFASTKLNKLIDALEDYNIAIKISNQFFQAYYNRAYIYFNLGDKHSAIDDYKKAINIKSDLYQAHYNLAIIYQQLGNYQQAIEEYKLTIKINPQYIKPYYNLAILLSNIGLYDKAINYYKQSLKINPDFFQSTYNYQSLSFLLKNENNILLNTPNVFPLSQENPLILKIEDPNSTVIKDADQQTTIH